MSGGMAIGSLVVVVATAVAGPAVAQGVFYDPPDVEVVARTVPVVPGGPEVDVYAPARTDGGARPAVVFVFGYPDARFGPLRKHEQYVSWARLVAAEGFVALLPEVRDPAGDLASLLDLVRREAAALGVDPARVALWSCSGNTALALKAARSNWGVAPAAFVAYYGLMPAPDGELALAMDSMSGRFGFVLPAYEPGEAYPADLPMLVVRAGADRWDLIRRSIDHFAAWALASNLPVTVRNHPAGQHAFDVLDDTAETRAVVRETLAFLRERLER